MKKMLLAFTAVATVAVTLLATASDADAQRRWRNGRWVGPAIVGGVATGLLLGGALANPYYGPGPAYVVEPGICYQRQRVWIEGLGWRWRRVAVEC